ncbi:VanZ family protein [Flavobacterium sp. IMCC34852]|uniref:VanZ family protein n=1 Tax=Flavobacterium rivulicola TaxID=2732161 RepID=A0A7Y3R7P4_9FLAO|nr:VanZ family protein [Flavobacterium sp. IMCC34852]NNT71366.1 VanZ family protein [Flavobacterium sp. IMCC34852]
MPKITISGYDKYGHFFFHFVFTLLWGYYFLLKQQQLSFRNLLGIVIVSLAYGILIEFLQENFTQTRQADVLDVLANFTGAVTALSVFVFLKKIKKV